MELTTLKGTEKQVTWAAEIRETLIAAHVAQLAADHERLAQYEAKGNDRHVTRLRRVIAVSEDRLRALALIPHAEWWIDRRNRNVDNLWQDVNGPAYASWLGSRMQAAIAETQTIWPDYNGQ